MTTNQVNTKILLVLFLASFLPNAVFASESLGYFNNSYLQDIMTRPFTLSFEDKVFPFPLDNYISVESTLVENPGYNMEIENPYYCPEKIGQFSLCDLARPITANVSFQKTGKVSINDVELKKELDKFSSKINKSPKNGTIVLDESRNISIQTQSAFGLSLNVDKTYEKIKDNLTNNQNSSVVSMVVDPVEPEVNTANINQFGIKELIGHGESSFAGSPTNRIHNIKVATDVFQGVLLKPGEEFSFTTILGDVDEEHGYKEELVIKNNETVPEFGGGVCQVSTTMFRVALNTGLEITERHNHAYPVSYYSPQGSDATVYVPKPDLRFINNTPAYIFIQTNIEGNKLSIDFYGTSDGRQVELDGPHVIEKTPDNKMKTILTQIVKDPSGEVIRKDDFKSFYDDPAKYHHEALLTQKPDNWSKKQWSDYKQQHGM